MRQYLIDGMFYCLHILPIAAGIYTVIFLLAWIAGKRKPLLSLIPRYIVEFVLTVYTCTILNITGLLNTPDGILPRFMTPNWQETLHMPFAGASFQMVLLNFLMFAPLGFLLPLTLHFKKKRLPKAILIAISFSVLIEVLQIFCGRFFEIDDIIINSLGAIAGAFIWQGARWIRTQKIKRGIICLLATLLISGLLLYGISFIANGDKLQQEMFEAYTELPNDAELEGNLSHIDFSAGLDGEPSLTSKTLLDSENIRPTNAYSFMCTDFSNNISQYEVESVDEIEGNPDDRFISVYLSEPQTFTFFNAPDTVMENVVIFIYDVDHGTMWYTNTTESFYKMTFVNDLYDYTPDERLVNLMDKMAHP